MLDILSFSFNHDSLYVDVIDDTPWFKGQDVATSLAYVDTTQAPRIHVESEEKKTLEEVIGVQDAALSYHEKNTIYISA